LFNRGFDLLTLELKEVDKVKEYVAVATSIEKRLFEIIGGYFKHKSVLDCQRRKEDLVKAKAAKAEKDQKGPKVPKENTVRQAEKATLVGATATTAAPEKKESGTAAAVTNQINEILDGLM
jgi:hypothetical protein